MKNLLLLFFNCLLLHTVFAGTRFTNDPYLSANSPNVEIKNREIHIDFKVNSNTNMSPTISVQFYYNGVPCMDSMSKSVRVGDAMACSFMIPFTSIYIPPGKQKLTYKIKGKAYEIKEKELIKGELEFEQPQLYWFAFETKNANINVEGLDLKGKIVKQFAQNPKNQRGDAFYQIQNNQETLFVSNVAKQSGNIKNEKAKIQTYPNEYLVFNFWDEDVLSKEFIYKIEFKPTTEPNQKLVYKNRDRILHFEIHYNFKPVTKENYQSR